MNKAPSTLLVILLMLCAFVGQNLAAQLAVTCEEPFNSDLSVHVNDTYKANLSNTSSINQTTECCSIACCELYCACTANTCSSVMYVCSDLVSNRVMLFAGSFFSPQTIQPSTITSLIYRPPILTA
jgi:hypothetical protein